VTGLAKVDQLLSRRKRKGRAEAALLAIDPKTGDILAMVAVALYNQSQYNRAVAARRQPGSVFKPFVYLTAFEQAAAAGSGLTPASIVDDSPTTWEFDDQVWTPENYEKTYDGPITLRRALAHSRNIATIKVAERIGFESRGGALAQTGCRDHSEGLPVDRARRVRGDATRDRDRLHDISEHGERPAAATSAADRTWLKKPWRSRKRRSRNRSPGPTPRTLVTNMMRSVLTEGTGAGARRAGFTLDAAGKTGTTNELRDAWFVGFTPDLLAVVWVGFDDNQPVGLSGAQAAFADLDPVHDTCARRFGPVCRSRCPRASASWTSIRRPESCQVRAARAPSPKPFSREAKPVGTCDLHRDRPVETSALPRN